MPPPSDLDKPLFVQDQVVGNLPREHLRDFQLPTLHHDDVHCGDERAASQSGIEYRSCFHKKQRGQRACRTRQERMATEGFVRNIARRSPNFARCSSASDGVSAAAPRKRPISMPALTASSINSASSVSKDPSISGTVAAALCTLRAAATTSSI